MKTKKTKEFKKIIQYKAVMEMFTLKRMIMMTQ